MTANSSSLAIAAPDNHVIKKYEKDVSQLYERVSELLFQIKFYFMVKNDVLIDKMCLSGLLLKFCEQYFRFNHEASFEISDKQRYQNEFSTI